MKPITVPTQPLLAIPTEQARKILDFLMTYPAKDTLHLIDFLRNAQSVSIAPPPVVDTTMNGKGMKLKNKKPVEAPSAKV